MESFLRHSKSEIRFADENQSCVANISLTTSWNEQETVCTSALKNIGDVPVAIKELVLCKGDMPFASDTKIYGEGYSKLSQYGGTVANPLDLTPLTDRGHYKLPTVDGMFTVYNLLLLKSASENTLIGFSSCLHFSGEIRFNANQYEIVLNFEGKTIFPNQIILLEELFIVTGTDSNCLFQQLADRINIYHPIQDFKDIPIGWCSWYYYGLHVTSVDICDNLQAIMEKAPELKYIQIDMGYEAFEGDWLVSSKSFPNGVKVLCEKIRAMGFEPAMWVGPFIAQEESTVFKKHPDWFKKDENGLPLSSDKYSYGGWHQGPWYMLDGTHPEAQQYLKHVFHIMHEDWKVNYFKMDGTMWGAMPFGTHYDPQATTVDAYRQGMKAIRDGSGKESFLLGCNAPMWPSLGTVNGMRLSNDISRSFPSFCAIAQEMFHRNWQHRRLWINDPDCILLQNAMHNQLGPDGENIIISAGLSENEFLFHVAVAFASGGMILSGDCMIDLPEDKLALLKKLIPSINVAAIFDDDSFTVGRTFCEECLMISVFNYEDTSKSLTIQLDCKYKIFDYFDDILLYEDSDIILLPEFEPHLGRIYRCIEN